MPKPLGDDAFELADGEDSKSEGAEEQGDGGRAALVDARDLAEEEAIAAHGVDDACAHQVEGVDGAEEGNDHDGAKDKITVSAEDTLGGKAERNRYGNLIHGENVEDRGVDEQVDDKE